MHTHINKCDCFFLKKGGEEKKKGEGQKKKRRWRRKRKGRRRGEKKGENPSKQTCSVVPRDALSGLGLCSVHTAGRASGDVAAPA